MTALLMVGMSTLLVFGVPLSGSATASEQGSGSNQPAWRDAYARDFPGCVDPGGKERSQFEQSLVVRLDAEVRLMTQAAVWAAVTDDDAGNDVWVVGVCAAPVWSDALAARFDGCEARFDDPAQIPGSVVAQSSRGRMVRESFDRAWRVNHDDTSFNDMWVVGVCS